MGIGGSAGARLKAAGERETDGVRADEAAEGEVTALALFEVPANGYRQLPTLQFYVHPEDRAEILRQVARSGSIGRRASSPGCSTSGLA